MEGLIWDAVPAQRKRKQELFSTPVVTMSALEKAGAGRKFSFNKAAQQMLGVVGEDRVSFGFSPSMKLIAVRKAEDTTGFQLTKTCTISDKKTFEYIAKMLDLNTSVENHFDIVVENSLNILSLVPNTLQFAVTNFGEVSDEEDLSSDTSSVPTAESFGVVANEYGLDFTADHNDDGMLEAIAELADTDEELAERDEETTTIPWDVTDEDTKFMLSQDDYAEVVDEDDDDDNDSAGW